MPKIKFIVLKRNKKETVNSFDQKTKGNDGWKDRKKEWSTYFTFKTTSKKGMLGEYYDQYYKEVDRLIEKYPKKIKLFTTDELNTNQVGIFKWCEIPEKDWKFQDNPRFNTIEDHKAYESRQRNNQ